MDPLILSCFSDQAKGRGLDLGTGCGVLALALLLRSEKRTMTGLEMDRDMVEIAKENGRMLGFDTGLDAGPYAGFEAMHGDVRDIRTLVKPESFDFAVTNPPYRERFRGRVNPDPSRAGARFEGEAGLESFIRAGAFAVKNKGLLFMVFPAERISELLVELTRAKMEPKRVMMVHPRVGESANLVMVEARKNGGMGCRVEVPLNMYEGSGEDSRLSNQALDFCPFIRCNP